MHREDISVVIAAYNAADTIGRALASVATQTVKPLEVLVIDDGSADATSEVASAMRNSMNGIELRLFTQQNAGAGAARNRGLAEAKGTFVAFLDADDAWLAGKVERCMSKLDETKDVLVAHDFIRIEASGNEVTINCAQRFQDAEDPFAELCRQGFIGTSTVVARRDALLAAGGFDESLQPPQDFDLWLKVLARPGETFTVLGEALAHHYVGAASTPPFTRRGPACTPLIAERNPAPGWLIAFLWLWVIVGSGAYAYRFQDLGLAALEMLTRL